MAAKVKFKLNQAGVAELLRSPGAQADLANRANRVVSVAGPGHDAKNTTTKRARYTVRTTTEAAAESEATNHTLTAAVNAARG